MYLYCCVYQDGDEREMFKQIERQPVSTRTICKRNNFPTGGHTGQRATKWPRSRSWPRYCSQVYGRPARL